MLLDMLLYIVTVISKYWYVKILKIIPLFPNSSPSNRPEIPVNIKVREFVIGTAKEISTNRKYKEKVQHITFLK